MTRIQILWRIDKNSIYTKFITIKVFMVWWSRPKTCRADDQGGRLQTSWDRQWSPQSTPCRGSVDEIWLKKNNRDGNVFISFLENNFSLIWKEIKCDLFFSIKKNKKRLSENYVALHFCFWRWSIPQHQWQWTSVGTVYICRSEIMIPWVYQFVLSIGL